MRTNHSGKILTIFSIIVAILLLTLTAISIFYTSQEKEKRKDAERIMQASITKISELKNEIVILKKDNILLQEKVKESDNSVNDLSDELELGKGLREQMKLEVGSLKEELEKVSKAKDQIKESFNKELSDSKAKIVELEATLIQEKEKFSSLKDSVNNMANKESEAKSEPHVMVMKNNRGVNLDTIVVAPGEEFDGKIISVDKETNFVIVNLGENDGVKLGDLMAVYRGEDYLGDVKITRLQPEMAAADFIPPFDSNTAKKDDLIIIRHDS